MLGFQVFCAMRRDEVRKLNFEDVTTEAAGSLKLVIVSRKNTKESSEFFIPLDRSDRDICVPTIFGLYKALVEPATGAIFRAFRFEKFQSGVLGLNMIGKRPRAIAEFLKLRNSDGFTGHSPRVSSPTILAEKGFTALEIQKHLGHKHPNVSISYCANSNISKLKVANAFLDEPSVEDIPVVPPKPEVENVAPKSTENVILQQGQPVFQNCHFAGPISFGAGGVTVAPVVAPIVGVKRVADDWDDDFVAPPKKRVARALPKKRVKRHIVGQVSP